MQTDAPINYSLFDFDGTLVRCDSLREFMLFTLGKRGFLLACLRALPWLLLWKAGMTDSGKAKEKLIGAAFGGMEAGELHEAAGRFAETLGRMERHDIVRELSEAVRRGDRVAIVSASPAEWIEPWAKTHGVNTVIATSLQTDNKGYLTGKFATPNCNGPEKVRRIFSRFPKLAEHRKGCRIRAWGDSRGDREMLAMADEANPVKG